MRIAQVAPLIERVPPKKYGGTERVVSALTEELIKRGHEVTLFASGDSITSAKLVSVIPRSVREMDIEDIYGANYFSMLNIGVAYEKQNEFDIMHDHNAHSSLPTANLSVTPVVMTAHGVFNIYNKQIYERLRNPYIVTISEAQKVPAPNLNYIGTVHNGLNMKHYPFSKDHDGYLLFAGRISAEKGVHYAIEVAENLNLPLIIAAKLDEYDVPYFKQHIEPRLSENIRWIGEVTEPERNRLMSNALCFLDPVQWREPFGLTLIEAAACGAPVVAFRRGSIPEIVVNGKTGFIVEDVEEMIEAVKRVNTIKRSNCRKHALTHFSAERMADGYEEVYRKILSQKHSEKQHRKTPIYRTN